VSQLSHAQFPLRRHPDLLVDHRRARSAAVAEPRGANVESRDRLRWPASFRNGGRNQIGTVADIKSESPAGLPRNSHLPLWVDRFGLRLAMVAAGAKAGQFELAFKLFHDRLSALDLVDFGHRELARAVELIEGVG